MTDMTFERTDREGLEMTFIISPDVVSLLRQSGDLLGDAGPAVAAEHVYAEFVQLPGGREFTYDLEVRIRSTAGLIASLIRAFSATPCDTGRIESVFRGIGLAHFRAGLPLSLFEKGPPIFVCSLAKAAHAGGHPWSSDHSKAWTELFTQGVAIQQEVYSSLTNLNPGQFIGAAAVLWIGRDLKGS